MTSILKRLTITFLLILMTLNLLPGQVQNKLFWDGKDWNKVSKLADHMVEVEYRMKAAYINGLQDGRLYSYLKTWQGDQFLADSIFSEPSDYLSTNELVRMLDLFYKDPVNSYIPVPSAIIIANLKAEQFDPESVDAYIKSTREWINGLMLQLQEDGNYDLLKAKQDAYKERLK